MKLASPVEHKTGFTPVPSNELRGTAGLTPLFFFEEFNGASRVQGSGLVVLRFSRVGLGETQHLPGLKKSICLALLLAISVIELVLRYWPVNTTFESYQI